MSASGKKTKNDFYSDLYELNMMLVRCAGDSTSVLKQIEFVLSELAKIYKAESIVREERRCKKIEEKFKAKKRFYFR